MARIVPQDLRDKKRINLATIVPLATPMLVYLDPSNLCNLRCTFCPTGYKPFRDMRPNGQMGWELFASIIDQMKRFPERIKQFTMCKDGEPLLNKRFCDMARYIRDADITERLTTKSNGLLLSPRLNDDLATCGLDMIGISVKGLSPEMFKEITGVRGNYARLVENVADLYSKRGQMKIYVSLLNTGLTDEQIAQYYRDFEPISDYISVEDLHGWSMSDVADFKLGQSAHVTRLTPKIVCPLVLCSMAVNFDGTVSICGEDWAHKTLIGDFNTQTIEQIWGGQSLLQLRRLHLMGQRGQNEACGSCDYIESLPDNYDNDRMQILGRLNENMPRL
jgi:radical SAM protein with 4Fe4S-binding SPASM domain